MKPNRMKDKIARGEPALGCSVMFPSPQIVEMLGFAGFDWVLIDCEHGSIGLADVELMAMACDAAGITPIARPKTNAASDIQSVMDRGVMGVQVPHVNSAKDAQEVLNAVKYHPLGKRSLAAGTRSAVYDSHGTLADYVKAANDMTLIAVQLEDYEAIEKIDEILKVDGIDVFFIGPSDLSQSMGHPGNPKEPKIAHAIDSSFEKMLKAGRTPGTPATSEAVKDVLGKGVKYIYTHLPRLLSGSAREYFAKAKG
jgi:4-hydroxy-2-oxoheptanedioate aldolase